ncbi:hypothetical protein ACIA5A_06135 [Micromonospora sp. NPDC051300]|uniref:hypothetical protein n=1 Tax=Micromonospora sp. NPDC051300 TaxID=3364286 RepID=UPI0037A38140
MKIRISGTVGQVDVTVGLLRRVLPAMTVSRRYPNRDGEVRVYVTCAAPHWRQHDEPACPWCLLPHTVDAMGRVPDGMAWSCRSCGRLFAMAHGRVVEATTVSGGGTQEGDWVRMPGGGWQVWDGRPIGAAHEVFRPSTGRPYSDVEGGNDR